MKAMNETIRYTKLKALSVLAVIFFMCAAFLPIRANAELSEHRMRPYQLYNASEYYGNPKETFTMMSNSFQYGLTKTGWNAMTACFNLEKKVSTVSFVVGHLDGGETPSCDLEIYLDDVYQTSVSRSLTSDMMNQKVTINTSGKQKLVIVITNSHGDYGIANMVQKSMHYYTSKVTKIATAKENGIRKYTCTDCGASYTETIPAKTYCTPYMFPYQANRMGIVNEEEGSSTNFKVMGRTWYKGLTKTGWDSGEALYNLNREYSSVQFTVGHVDGWETPSTTLWYYVDSVEMGSVPLAYDMTDQVISIPNLSSAMQLKITIGSSHGDYAIYNMKGVPVNPTPKPHKYVDEVTLEAQFGLTGIITHRCSECGAFYTSSSPALQRSLLEEAVTAELTKDSYIFNGKLRTPGAVVKYNDEVLNSGVDYKITYQKNKSVGKATATITGIGNYKDSIRLTFTIKKCKQPMTAKGKTVTLKASTVKKKAKTFKALVVKKGKGKLTYKIVSGSKAFSINAKNGAITVKKRTRKGTYTLRVQVTAAGNANYKKGSRTVTVKVKIK